MTTKATNNNIAIVGMGCTFPGAHSPKELWQNVLAGRRYFRKIPKERLPLSLYFHQSPKISGKTYSDQAALISDWIFDPIKFRLAPITVLASDLTHWLALDTATKAIADSNLNLQKEDTARIGCIIGNSLGGEFARSHNLRLRSPYLKKVLSDVFTKTGLNDTTKDQLINDIENYYNAPFPNITEDTLAGNMSNTIVGRITNHFNLGGGGYTVDGACSSSLLALLHGANALINREMDIVLTGGVDISLDPFELVGFAKTKALSPDDIKVYDKGANGMLPGEGCGIVVLMREEDAINRGLKIYALLKGWGYSTDGRGGITAPNIEGQARAIQKAYEKAGYNISSIGLIEGHGTGTALGDKVELQAIQKVIEQSTPAKAPIYIGSIKSNIGHCKAAAGIAGFIKVVMALKHKILPATTNCLYPNSLFNSSLQPAMRNCIWEKTETPRRASVSAMGFGGSNAHVTLEEFDPKVIKKYHPVKQFQHLGSMSYSELILLSGEHRLALQGEIEKLLPVVKKISRAELPDLSAALSKQDSNGKYRIAILSFSPWDLQEKFQKILRKFEEHAPLTEINDPERGVFFNKAKQNPKCVFLFPGQGSQRLNSGSDIIHRFPELKKFSADIELPKELTEYCIKNYVNAPKSLIREWEKELKQTAIAQPAIVFSSLLFWQMLDNWNLKADTLIGHSLGEITALCIAGAYSPNNAIRLAAQRGKAMSEIKLDDSGKMIVLFEKEEIVSELIEQVDGIIKIANYNAPKQIVLSGSTSAIDQCLMLCKEQEISAKELSVSHAFHSPIVAKSLDAFRKKISQFTFCPLEKPIYSTLSAKKLDKDIDIKEYLCEQVSQPVQFIKAVQQAQAEIQPDLWIEVGPGGVLASLVKKILSPEAAIVYATDNSGPDDFYSLHRIFAQAYVIGFPLDSSSLFEHRYIKPFDIESYQPIFITNPCERRVPPPAINSDFSNGTHLLKPKQVDSSQWQSYLQLRKHFLKDFIALDFQHFVNDGKHFEASVLSERKQPNEDPIIELKEEEPLLDFVISWISNRTGFPASVINPSMKLRDDLNLDSIKATELVLILAEKLDIRSAIEPQAFSNQSIIKMIEQLNNLSTNQISYPPVKSSEITRNHWIKTFPVSWINHPINDLHPTKLLSDTAVSLYDLASMASEKEWTQAFRKAELKLNYFSQEKTWEKFISNDNACIVLIVPEENASFLIFDPKENYLANLSKQARLFFDFFKSMATKDISRNVSCLIISRHESFVGQETSAPFAALKSFVLEHPNWSGKWIQTSASIPLKEITELIKKELVYESNLMFIRYDKNKIRQVWGSNKSVRPAINNNARNNVNFEQQTVLVTGGGKGITFKLAQAFANSYKNTTLVILGRTALPESDSLEVTELSENLKQLNEAKIKHFYFACDITDAETLSKLMPVILRKSGTITGILHGAGISKLSSIKQKKWPEYWSCLNVKAMGLYNILSMLPLEKLRFLHTLSSVIGKTGMSGQFDYAYANAWLDGLMERLKREHPNLHVLSMGYSVWSDVGIGEKLGAVKQLKQMGITAISPKEGINAYLNLLQGVNTQYSNVIILGRLPDQMERGIYVPKPKNDFRFLEKIIHWIPDVSMTIETRISPSKDWYLLEHVFEGSIIFPGVMALEAMLQAVRLFSSQSIIPLITDLQFLQPLIINPEQSTTIRIEVAFKEPNIINATIVNVKRPKQLLFTAEMSFQQSFKENGISFKNTLPALPLNVEHLNPDPLFQGKMFRRINKVYKMKKGDECIVEIKNPDTVHYFENTSATIALPAIQDSLLQAGLLVLPPRSLPESIEKLKIYRLPEPNEKIICKVKVLEYSEKKCLAYLHVYDKQGQLIETMEGVRTNVVKESGISKTKIPSVLPIPMDRLVSDFKALTPRQKIGLQLLNAKKLVPEAALDIAIDKEINPVSGSQNNTKSKCINDAIQSLCQQLRIPKPSLGSVSVKYTGNGKPLLQVQENLQYDWHLSLSDSSGWVLSAIGENPVGIDIELVEIRNAELWMNLLGPENYRNALNLSLRTGESFDRSASRFWTIKEAVFKATGQAITTVKPQFESALGGSWFLYSNLSGNYKSEIYSSMLKDDDSNVFAIAIALTMKRK